MQNVTDLTYSDRKSLILAVFDIRVGVVEIKYTYNVEYQTTGFFASQTKLEERLCVYAKCGNVNDSEHLI